MDIPGEFMMAVYIFLSFINVWASSSDRKWIPFCITKPILMLVLIGVYVTNSSSVLLCVVLALFFAWLGDVLLLDGVIRMGRNAKPGLNYAQSNLVLGGFAFIICHLFYIWTFNQIGSSQNEWPLYGIVMLVYMIVGKLFYDCYIRDFLDLDNFIKWGIGLYEFAILIMSSSSVLIIKGNELYTFVPFIGSLFFLLSDYLLALGYKMKNAFIYHPWVMASYLTAQFLIIAGLVLSGY
ncbi:MAG TPA: lysoplasmalogenase [Syntrophomonadaceae bacterium]|nr:lysoplasmalogenase [Syntrophomonadaceae bacterium]